MGRPQAAALLGDMSMQVGNVVVARDVQAGR